MASQLTGVERRDFWLLCFGQLLTFCGFFAFFQFPLYIKAVGGTEESVGVIMGVTSLASTLLLPWITAMSDRMERRAMMLGGIVLVELSTMATMFTVAPDVWMALLAVARGLGMAVYMNGAGAYMAQILPPGERSRWIGMNFGFNQVATALGPLFAEIAIRQVGFAYFFLLCTAFVYTGMLMVLAIHRRAPPPPETRFEPLASLTGFLRGLVGPHFRNPFLALLLMAGALGAVTNFTATYTQTLGLSSGVFFANYALINAVSRMGGGGLADRYGRGMVVIPMLLLFGAGLYLYSFTVNTWMMLVSGLLIGVGFGLSNPALLALMLDRVPSTLHGRAIGSFHFAYQLGFLVMPPIFGWVAENFGFRPMWWLAGVLPFAALLVYLTPEGRMPAAAKSEAGPKAGPATPPKPQSAAPAQAPPGARSAAPSQARPAASPQAQATAHTDVRTAAQRAAQQAAQRPAGPPKAQRAAPATAKPGARPTRGQPNPRRGTGS
jgi:MFS family permease